MGLLVVLMESMHVDGHGGVGNRQGIGQVRCPGMGLCVRDWTVLRVCEFGLSHQFL